MHHPRQQRLRDFLTWTATHITGDEKSQSQIFLDYHFRAFGHPGVLESGASFEFHVKNTKGGTAFADLVWKPKSSSNERTRHAPESNTSSRPSPTGPTIPHSSFPPRNCLPSRVGIRGF